MIRAVSNIAPVLLDIANLKNKQLRKTWNVKTFGAVCSKLGSLVIFLRCYKFQKRKAVLTVKDIGKTQSPRQRIELEKDPCLEASWSKANKKIFETKTPVLSCCW